METCGEFIHSNYFLLSWTGELGLFSSKDDLGLERALWKLFRGLFKDCETCGSLGGESLSTWGDPESWADPTFT